MEHFNGRIVVEEAGRLVLFVRPEERICRALGGIPLPRLRECYCENVLNSTVAVCRATNSTPAKKRAVADVGPKISSLSALAALLRGGAASGGAQESVPASSGAATATAVPAEAAAATRALAVSEVSSEQMRTADLERLESQRQNHALGRTMYADRHQTRESTRSSLTGAAASCTSSRIPGDFY